MSVKQLRLVVHAEDYEEALRFFRDVLGMPQQEAYAGDGGAEVTILDAGRATLELANSAQVEMIDDVEVGRRVAGHFRVALEVDDCAAASEQAAAGGAVPVAPPTRTPWNSLNARFDAPGEVHLTLFQELRAVTHLRPGRDLGRRRRGRLRHPGDRACSRPRCSVRPSTGWPPWPTVGGRWSWPSAPAGSPYPWPSAVCPSPASSCPHRWSPGCARRPTRPRSRSSWATWRRPGPRASSRLVYLVFNTISNLLTQDEQVACFANAARHLEPGGRFVVELWVPELRRLPPGVPATVGVREDGYILIDTYDVLHQHVVSHHFTFDESGGPGGPPRASPAPLHLAERAGPDGAAGRVRAGDPARRLAGRGVHRRLALARLGLPLASGA